MALTNGRPCDEGAHNAGCGRERSEEQEEARCPHYWGRRSIGYPGLAVIVVV